MNNFWWSCEKGHAVLEGQPHVCPWCKIATLERVVAAAREIRSNWRKWGVPGDEAMAELIAAIDDLEGLR